jgi:hypothetical protein
MEKMNVASRNMVGGILESKQGMMGCGDKVREERWRAGSDNSGEDAIE